MSQEKLTGKRLRDVVSYDPATGIFLWVDAFTSGRWKHATGDVCGTVRRDGYRRIFIDGKDYQANQLAWFWVHGEMPSRNIWFKDGNRDNVAIENLTFGRTDSKDLASMNAYSREWRAANPDKRRAMQRKAYYGMTVGQFKQMLLDQKGVCACCGNPETRFHKGKPTPLCVDHDHTTNEIRGLCCRSCNSGLGLFKDNIEAMERAIALPSRPRLQAQNQRNPTRRSAFRAVVTI